jgi:hypothetical protein
LAIEDFSEKANRKVFCHSQKSMINNGFILYALLYCHCCHKQDCFFAFLCTFRMELMSKISPKADRPAQTEIDCSVVGDYAQIS